MLVRLGAISFCLGVAGCIERTVSIDTEPRGATVFLNDEEVGQSPARVPFTWYGDYDIVIRKPGYETIQTHHNLKTPWYELPGIDLITECLIPFTVHDDRVLETFVLTPSVAVNKDTLLESAEELRSRAGAAR
jgi:hypothetical protein